MKDDLQISHTATAGATMARVAGTTSAVMALFVAACMIGAPVALAQDTSAPPKVKMVKPKAAAKAKEATADDDEQKPAAAPVKRDPAQAQRTFESGVKLLQAGKAEPAIQSFNSVISGGNVPPQLMARALHQRGVAYRAAGKPAQAVSDLTSALWLKGGLNDAERAEATQQRSAAYREAGLPDQADPVESKAAPKRTAAAPVSVGGTVSAASPPVTTASLAPEPARAPEQPASPLGTFFGNLFGGGSSSAASAPAAAAPQPSAQPATSGWSSAPVATPATANAAAPSAPAPKTARAAAMVAPPPASTPAPAAATPAKAVADGSVHARMLTRSEAEANTLAGRLKSEFSGPMGGRAPAVSQAQFGGMGSFFQVRVGPYKTQAEAQAFCARIKSTGADCVAVSQ